MKTTSTHMALVQLEPVTYEVTVDTVGVPLVPPPFSISAYESISAKTVSIAASVPRWLKAGMTVAISGETTTKSMNKSFRVKFIDPELTYFDVEANWLTGALPFVAAAGTVIATAQFYAQRMVVRNPSGVVLTLQPTSGTAFGYQPAVAAGAEKEITAPNGAKFDAAEWHGRVAAATQIMQVYLL